MGIKEILAAKRAAQLQETPTQSVVEAALVESGSVAPEDIEDVASIEEQSLLSRYPTFDALKASPYWASLRLMERMRVQKEYAQQQKISAEPPPNAVVIVPTKENEVERIDASVIRPATASEQLFHKYPSFQALKESHYYQSLSVIDRAAVAREYTKQMQIQAAEALKAQRSLESEVEAEEVNKALKQGAASLLGEAVSERHESFSLSVVLNDRQQLGVDYAIKGESFVLTGAAGTGKTTACREIARAFLKRGDLGSHTFKLDGGERYSSHGIAFCAYTRRATSNIRRALHRDPELEKELDVNVLTIHRLLEYEPEFYTDPLDPTKTRMRFEPKRTAQRPLNVKIIVIEEASMLGLDLWMKLHAACRPGTIFVFVGDINQLPPVFGKSIMNYALAQLPVVELTEVYRQALDSGIIVNAHRVLKGEEIEENKDVKIIEGNAKDKQGKPVAVGQERMARALGAMFHKLWETKEYDPTTDVILSPWNKQPLGTANMNSWIAQFLGEQRNAMVHEVFAGRNKLYLAIGDRVMYEKQDGIIISISHNMRYLGRMPQPASTALTRFGMRKMAAAQEDVEDFELSGAGYEHLNIDEVADEEKKQEASHVVTIKLDDGGEETLNSIGDFAEQKFTLGYCLTVHKSQGCEWRKVFIILHKDHTLGGFLTRELMYTAITRAREKLVLIGKRALFKKAIANQTIKGKTLEEKIQSINSGATNIGQYPVTK